jgi:hypothetical protein
LSHVPQAPNPSKHTRGSTTALVVNIFVSCPTSELCALRSPYPSSTSRSIVTYYPKAFPLTTSALPLLTTLALSSVYTLTIIDEELNVCGWFAQAIPTPSPSRPNSIYLRQALVASRASTVSGIHSRLFEKTFSHSHSTRSNACAATPTSLSKRSAERHTPARRRIAHGTVRPRPWRRP